MRLTARILTLLFGLFPLVMATHLLAQVSVVVTPQGGSEVARNQHTTGYKVVFKVTNETPGTGTGAQAGVGYSNTPIPIGISGSVVAVGQVNVGNGVDAGGFEVQRGTGSGSISSSAPVGRFAKYGAGLGLHASIGAAGVATFATPPLRKCN